MPGAWERIGAIALALALAGGSTGCLGGDGSHHSPAEATAPPGEWRTWVLASGSEIEVQPPPSEGTAEARADERDLAKAVASRDVAGEESVRRWDRRPAPAPWMELALESVSRRPKDPPYASRAYGYVAVAMYDAAVSAAHWQREYTRPAPSENPLVDSGERFSYPDSHAAIAGAASRVLAYLFPERPLQRLEADAEQAAASRVTAGVSRPADVEAGLALGREVGDRVVAYAKRDGINRRWDGSRPPRSPAHYDSPPGTVAEPIQPLAGTWRPWVMESGDQFRAPPPPPYGSADFERGVREVIEAKENLTDEQRRAALFWAGGEGTVLPPGIWEGVVIEYLADRRLTLAEATRVLALCSVAMADAGIASWDSKYHYWHPRPENAVRDTGADPSWKPLIATPFFPAYTSGHASYSGAVSEVLAYLFPEEAEDWREKAREAAESRVWGGIHWSWDGTEGLQMGRRVAELVVGRAAEDGANP